MAWRSGRQSPGALPFRGLSQVHLELLAELPWLCTWLWRWGRGASGPERGGHTHSRSAGGPSRATVGPWRSPLRPSRRGRKGLGQQLVCTVWCKLLQGKGHRPPRRLVARPVGGTEKCRILAFVGLGSGSLCLLGSCCPLTTLVASGAPGGRKVGRGKHGRGMVE